MKKLKTLITCVLAIGVIAASSISSLAVSSVNFHLYYTNVIYANSLVSRTTKIEGDSLKYFAKCTDSYNRGQLGVYIQGTSKYTLDKGTSKIIKRNNPTAGNISVEATLLRVRSGAASVDGYVEKR